MKLSYDELSKCKSYDVILHSIPNDAKAIPFDPCVKSIDLCWSTVQTWSRARAYIRKLYYTGLTIRVQNVEVNRRQLRKFNNKQSFTVELI